MNLKRSWLIVLFLNLIISCAFGQNNNTVNLKQEIVDAIKNRDLKSVENLFQNSPEQINAKDNQGRTALRLACEENYVEIAEYLIKKVSDVNSKDNQGTSILFFSCIRFKHDAAKLLVKNGADVNIKTYDLQTPLHGVFNPWGTDIELVKLLIEHGADVNAVNERNETPLVWALGNNEFREKAIKLLISNGANMNHFDGKTTLLHVAVNNNSTDKVRVLLENGARINQHELFLNNTELHLAAINGNLQITKLLLDYGANVNALNTIQKSPLYYASKYGHKDASDLLIQKGADKNQIVEENYNYSGYLSEKLDDKQFYCWNLDDDGWAVKTKNYLLLFDASNRFDTSINRFLANGYINPEELKEQKILVFCTKSDMGYYNPAILNLANLHKNVTYYFGFDPKEFQGHNSYDLSKIEYKLLNPEIILRDEVLEIKPFRATQGGVGFVVNIDNLTLFFNGWHVSNNANFLEQYKTTVNQLEPQFRNIDCAFLPVVSHAVNAETINGYYYLIKNCKLKNILLTHGNWGRYASMFYHIFYRQLKEFTPGIYVNFPENPGDRFFIDSSEK